MDTDEQKNALNELRLDMPEKQNGFQLSRRVSTVRMKGEAQQRVISEENNETISGKLAKQAHYYDQTLRFDDDSDID